MELKNVTKQTILAHNLKHLTSLMDQTRGMLSYKEPTALLLKTRFGIHTLFMKYPIDILILDKNNTVKAMKQNMKPNDLFMWNPKYNTVIELPTGIINSSNTKLHDRLSFNS